jgi:hypothetical protein
MHCNDNTLRGLVQGEADVRGITNRIITIGDACIIEVNGRFFLLVDINFDNFDTVLVIRISRTTARILSERGIRNCPVFTTLPTDIQRVAVDLECVFTVGDDAFLVFETERAAERLERIFVVRVPLCPIIGNDDC